MAAQKPLSLPGHSPVPAPSPPPRGTVTYLAGTVCSQGTRDTGRSGPRCPVPARRRALGDGETGRTPCALPARGAQRVPPTAPGTRAGREGSPPSGAAGVPARQGLTGCRSRTARGRGTRTPSTPSAGRWPGRVGLSAPARAHPFHLEVLGLRATPTTWSGGNDLGFGFWGGRAGGSFPPAPRVPLRRASARTLQRFSVVLALVYFYFPGI